MESWDVIIVGGGVGGAALALALAHDFPLRILVIEKQSGPGKINRGDSLLPAVTAQLAAWGALDRFRAAGARQLQAMQVYHHTKGLLLETSLAGLGLAYPYLVLPHPEIERTLLESACAGGRVEVRHECAVAGLWEENGRVLGAMLSGAGGVSPECLRAKLVVGADGSSSLIRDALGIAFPRVPYDHGYFGLEMTRPANYQDAMRIELHPAGGILVVPNPKAERVGLGVLVHRKDEDLFRSGSFEDKLAAIRVRSPLLAGCDGVAKGSHLYKLYRSHAERYVARGAALIGDAIHVTNPTAGQGMTMAIEDAAALARHVGPVLAAATSDTAIDRALVAYEAERRPKNAALIRWSHWMSRFYAMPGLRGDWLRRQVFGFGGSFLGKFVQKAIWSRVASRPIQEVRS